MADLDTTMWETHCRFAFEDMKAQQQQANSEMKRIREIMTGNGKKGYCAIVDTHDLYFKVIGIFLIMLLGAFVTQTAIVVRQHVQDDTLASQVDELVKELKGHEAP